MIGVHLSADGWPYWTNILVVGIACYTTLFLSSPLTPIVETLGKNIPANIWLFAHVEPAKKQMTLFPFRDDLFEERNTDDERDGSIDEEKRVDKV